MFLKNIHYRIAVFRWNKIIPRRINPTPHIVINIKFNPTGSNAILPSIITALIASAAKDVGIKSISGTVSNPPKNWSGRMINHARPPAELAVLTTDASIKPKPRDVNATKKGIMNNKIIFALELKDTPNSKVRRSITTICIAATINCENRPDNNTVERETGVVIRRCNVPDSFSSAKCPANCEINTIGARITTPGANMLKTSKPYPNLNKRIKTKG